MIIRLSEAEFIDMLYKTPLHEFIQMEEEDYQQHLRRIESILFFMRTARKLGPMLVSCKTIKDCLRQEGV